MNAVNDAWEELTTLPCTVFIMGNPFTFDSTGMPPWVNTQEPPDALRGTDGELSVPQTQPAAAPTSDSVVIGITPLITTAAITSGTLSMTTTPATTLETIPTATGGTQSGPKPSGLQDGETGDPSSDSSSDEDSAGEDPQAVSVITTMYTSKFPCAFTSTVSGNLITGTKTCTKTGTTTTTTQFPTETSPDGGLDPTAKTALSTGIPVAIFLILLILVGGFILGRRKSKGTSQYRERRRISLPLRAWKQDPHVRLEDQEYLNMSQERHELLGEDMLRKLPTNVNVPEMEEMRAPVELPLNIPRSLK